MIKIKNNGTWVKTKPLIKVNNNWAKIKTVYIKDSGIWKVVYRGQDIILLYKSFDCYTTLTNDIPISLILDGAIDEYSNNQDPITLQSVSNPVGGSVIISGSVIKFTSTGAANTTASFQYGVINSTNHIKTGTVYLNIVSVPDIVCIADNYDLQQNESTILNKTLLTTNDIDYSGSALTVTSVDNPIGGTVTLSGNNITFLSTGLAGQPASFRYKVQNTYGVVQYGNVNFNITPLPSLEALIYPTTESFNNAVATLTPPTMTQIFNTWARTDGASYYANITTATGTADDWQLLTNPDRISMPTNTGQPCTFISPDILNNYTLEATLNSPGTDDDGIGLVMAFDRSTGYNQFLAVIRTQGGTAPNLGFGIVYYDYSDNTSWVINNISVGGVNQNGVSGDKLGWNNRNTRVKIQRQDNIFKVWCTNWNDIGNYQAGSELTLDLNSDPRLTKFLGKKSYGYYTYSQAGTTYYDVVLKGNLDYSKIFDYQTGLVKEYIDGVWVNSAQTIQQILGYIRTVRNPLTGDTFIIKESIIEYIGTT